MKRLAVFFLGILFYLFPANSAEPGELVRQANEAYVNSEYSYAIELYELVLEQKLESFELYYNLGNAWFREGRYGKSILNYERALRFRPSDENTLFNLEVARARTVDRINPVPQIFYERWWNNFVALLSTDGWSFFALALLVLTLSFLGVYFFSRTRGVKKAAFGLAFVFGLLCFMAFGLARTQYARTHQQLEAIVMVPRATAKSSPGESSPDLFVIHEGSKARITTELGDWYEVRLANGNVGWVKKSALEII